MLKKQFVQPKLQILSNPKVKRWVHDDHTCWRARWSSCSNWL